MTFPETLPIPAEVLKIAKKLEDAGFETWCVGGAIRDNLLGVENHDFDLTTAAPPAEIQKAFKRTVPVGIEHGTVAVLDASNQAHEVTTFRKDIQTDGRHAVVEFGVSIMDDLARRDFTINAIAYHPIRHEWRDPFQGEQDLAKKLIRSVGDPNWRFQTVLWAALAECSCQERRCKNLTAVDDLELGTLEFTHGEGRRSWPRERYGQGLIVDLIDWFREIHSYEDQLDSR